MTATSAKKTTGASLLALDKTQDSKFRDKELNRRKTVKEAQGPKRESGVIYLGCIPHGFFENEMYDYFSQFGGVRRVLLVRSKKTGRSRGYGFVEFYWKEVAAVVANTMDGYLTYRRIMKCKLLERHQVPRELFSKKNRITKDDYPALHQRKSAILKLNQPRSSVTEKKRLQRLKKTYRKKLKHLNTLGIRLDLFSNKKTRRGQAKTKSDVEATNQEMSDEEMEDSEGEQQPADEELEGDIQDSEINDEEDSVQDEDKAQDEDSAQEEEMTEEYQEPLDNYQEDLAAKIKLNLSRANIQPGSDGKFVLEVDESDDEIEFKTPPNAVKKFVKVSSSSKSPSASAKSKTVESGDEIQLKTPESMKNIKRKCDGVEDAEKTPTSTGIKKKKKFAKVKNVGQEELPAEKKSTKKPITPKKISDVKHFEISKLSPSPDSTQATKKTPKKNLNPKKTPTSTPKTPASIVNTPLKNKSPTSTKKTPASTKKTPTSTKKTPTSIKKTPASTPKTPPLTNKTPASTKKTPTPKTPTFANKTSPLTPKTSSINKTPTSAKKTPKTPTAANKSPKTPTAANKSPKNYMKLSSKKSPASMKFPTPKKISKSPK